MVGLPDFWLTGWLPGPFASRTTSMEIYGPKLANQDLIPLRQRGRLKHS